MAAVSADRAPISKIKGFLPNNNKEK